MKTIYLFAILVCVLAVAAYGVSGPASRTDLTGTDTGLGLLPPPPTITQQGNSIHVRGLNGYSHFVLTGTDGSTLFDGTGYFSLNANWLLRDYTGPVWGTFRMADTAGNTAEVICHGVRQLIGQATWQAVFHCTGLGTGGTFDGKLFQLTETVTTHDPMPAAFVGEITGSMLEPASQRN